MPNSTSPTEQQPSGHIQVYWIRGRDEMWHFRLMREDGKTVMDSYSYGSQREMEEAVAWVRANAGRVEIFKDKGRPRRPPANRRRPRSPLPPGWIFVLPRRQRDGGLDLPSLRQRAKGRGGYRLGQGGCPERGGAYREPADT